jgi:hypothetical protein
MTESSKLSLLQATLSVAVPLRIAELRHKPLAEILDPEALSYIQTRLAEAREEVLYSGKAGADGVRGPNGLPTRPSTGAGKAPSSA